MEIWLFFCTFAADFERRATTCFGINTKIKERNRKYAAIFCSNRATASGMESTNRDGYCQCHPG